MNKLDWGCASVKHDGWTGSDRDDYGQEHIGEILDGLPWPDQHFDVIVANHSLQMVKYTDLPAVLAELRRVLKIGGTLRVLVPDLMRAIHAYQDGDAAWFPIVNDAERHIGGKLCAYITWYSEANLVFTRSWLAELLQRNGFEASISSAGVTLIGPPEITELDTRPTESIVVEGRRLDDPVEDE